MTDFVKIFQFETDTGLGKSARLGLIVLQTDQTIEYEFKIIFNKFEDIALYASRIPNAMEVSSSTLRRMEKDLPRAAELLPAQFDFDVIGYACTSGATLIGEEKIERLLQNVHPKAAITNPITASKASLKATGIKKIALLTPYPADVTLEMQANFERSGFQIKALATFDESNDFTVARIKPDSILKAITDIGLQKDCDGVFVSCTSLRALKIIQDAEAIIGKPVISSNQALAWHMTRLAGVGEQLENVGSLFRVA